MAYITNQGTRHRNYRDNAEKREWNQQLLNHGIKVVVEVLRHHKATEDQVKAFYKSLNECKSSYYTKPMETAFEAVLPKSLIAPVEYYLRGIAGGMSEIRDSKLSRDFVGSYRPLRMKLMSMESDVMNRMRREIGKKLDVYMGTGPAPEGKIKVPTSHEKQVKNLGIREINGRFILSAEQVDEVGEFKLFQISYVTRGDSVASNTLQWGYVSTYNGGHWAFAQSPSRAMAAAKTLMVKAATAKLAR
jgi:hypothetical protein